MVVRVVDSAVLMLCILDQLVDLGLGLTMLETAQEAPDAHEESVEASLRITVVRDPTHIHGLEVDFTPGILGVNPTGRVIKGHGVVMRVGAHIAILDLGHSVVNLNVNAFTDSHRVHINSQATVQQPRQGRFTGC